MIEENAADATRSTHSFKNGRGFTLMTEKQTYSIVWLHQAGVHGVESV